MLRLENVKDEGFDPRPLFAKCLEQVIADVGRIDLGALAGHRDRRRPAYALRRRCDQRRLAFQPIAHAKVLRSHPYFSSSGRKPGRHQKVGEGFASALERDRPLRLEPVQMGKRALGLLGNLDPVRRALRF